MSNWIDNQRCPQCLNKNVFQYQFGNYRCKQCDIVYRPDMLDYWNNAFRQGCKFIKQNSYLEEWEY